MNKTIILILATTIILMGVISVNADPTVTLTNSSSTTTDTTPNIVFTYVHSTNATANCTLYMDSVNRDNNATTINNTATTLTPTTALNYERYNTYVNCTTIDGNSNVSNTITVGIAQIPCTGVEKTLTTFLITLFMLGLVITLAFFGFKSGDWKMIVGAGIGLIMWAIAIGIINPVIVSLCG